MTGGGSVHLTVWVTRDDGFQQVPKRSNGYARGGVDHQLKRQEAWLFFVWFGVRRFENKPLEHLKPHMVDSVDNPRIALPDIAVLPVRRVVTDLNSDGAPAFQGQIDSHPWIHQAEYP